LNQTDNESKKQVLGEIATLRSDVSNEPKIRVVVQEEINDVLDGIVREIQEDGSEDKLNLVGSKISLMKKRAYQAKTQEPWLAPVLGMCLFGFVALGAWGIYEGEFWPKAVETTGREVLFGSVLWGLIGASIDGFRELHTRLARQELDPNRLAWYLTHPLIGAGLGGILFLLVSAGLLVTGQEVGTFNPSLPLILAALAGFEQRDIIRYLRDTVKKILGIDLEKKSADEGG
jgi:hypothetical protein